MRRHGGYTLLEMVVVLALLAMATALVAPAGYRMIQAWRDASEVDAVVGELRALSWRARMQGNAFHVPAGATLPLASGSRSADRDPSPSVPFELNLPDGWSLAFDTPLKVGANGVCQDSRATLSTLRQVVRLRIEAPFCRVGRLEGSTE